MANLSYLTAQGIAATAGLGGSQYVPSGLEVLSFTSDPNVTDLNQTIDLGLTLNELVNLMQEYTNGAAWVTIKDSLVEIESVPAGEAIANTATSQQSSTIAGTAVDISTDSTDDVFVAIGSNPTAVVDTSYHIEPNSSYRFAITPGNKVAVIATGTNGKTWIHGVA